MTRDLVEGLVLGLVFLLILSSCRMWDELRVSVGYEQSTLENDRPMSSFDGDSVGVYVTPVWYWGATREAYANLASLDVNRAGELTTHERHGAGETTVNVEQRQEQEAEAESEAAAEASASPDIDLPAVPPGEPEGAAAAGPLSWLPAPPKTLEEAYPWLAWIAGVSFLLWVLGKTGLADRLIPRRRDG